MLLYYAMGGGLGHLVRARAVLHTLGCERDAALLTASSYARDPRVVGTLAVHAVPAGCIDDPAAYRRWLAATLRRLQPEEIFVDTFPAGLLGELADVDLAALTQARLTHVARLLRWEAYVAAVSGPDQGRGGTAKAPRFSRVLRVEPLHAAHDAALRELTDEVIDLELCDPPLGPDGPTPMRASELPQRFWLVAHAGPADELAELVAYARDLQRLAHDPAALVVAAPTPARGARDAGDLLNVDLYPASALFARAARVVSACGFNVMRQTEPHADRHSFMPLQRRYDDQFARAARRRDRINPRVPSAATAPAS